MGKVYLFFMKQNHGDRLSGEAERKKLAGGHQPGPRRLAAGAWAALLVGGLVWSPPTISAQDSTPRSPRQDPAQKTSKTYPVKNGSVTYTRTEESERRKTREGDIETQRVRMPSWQGDHRVLLERETRTMTLADGVVERESVLKNPDGGGHLVPIEIVRERVKKVGGSTSVEREILKPDFEGHWKALRKETVLEAGPDTAKQTVQEVREPTVTGEWRVVDRQVTTEKSSQGRKESHSVRQLPDASGRLADYEVREERTTARGDAEAHEVTVRRRDFQDTEARKFYLVERTLSEQSKSPDGKVTRNSTTESDLLAGGAARNVSSAHPVIVEEKSEEHIHGKDGAGRTVLRVKERGVADSRVRPSYQVIQETDREGHIRQLFIPLR